MKINYILKKGFQFFPCCLAQVLYLNDLGVELTVYHGVDTDYINCILEQRKIQHHVMKFDSVQRGRFRSVKRFLSYNHEVRRIIKKIPRDEIIWFGSGESAFFLGRVLNNRRIVLSILELYGNDLRWWRGKAIEYPLRKATIITCCEKHRASIMYGRYGLKKIPYILPNKPYEFEDSCSNTMPLPLQDYEHKFIVLYQGVIHPERPLLNIAKALNKINDGNIVFIIMGKFLHDTSEQMIEELKKEYRNTIYLGFISNPEHLAYTQFAKIGIAVYDFSSLNTIFCAPNKIYEYAKFGVPMLCSQNIGLQETVGAAMAGECVDYSNVDAIVDGLKKIREKHELYSQNAFSFYNSINNRTVIESLIKELQSVNS